MKSLLCCLALVSLVSCEYPQPKQHPFTSVIQPKPKSAVVPEKRHERLKELQKELRSIRDKIEPREP